MEFEFILLGLIRMHQDITGYELNRMLKIVISEATPVSFSQIYPALKRMHDKGWVTFNEIPIKNRPSKKVYQITEKGNQELQGWLRQPIKSRLDFTTFNLKVVFFPLMDKATILDHIDREIDYLEKNSPRDRGIKTELDYIDDDRFDMSRTEFLWGSILNLGVQTADLRLAWLHKFRQEIEDKLTD